MRETLATTGRTQMIRHLSMIAVNAQTMVMGKLMLGQRRLQLRLKLLWQMEVHLHVISLVG